MDNPKVLRPGNSAAVTMVTEDRRKVSVLPSWLNSKFLKSEVVMFDGFLQGKPLMNTVSEDVSVGQVSWRLSLFADKLHNNTVAMAKRRFELNIFFCQWS